MKNYWIKISQEMGKFANAEDEIRADFLGKQSNYCTCELCGYRNILWLFKLENPRTGKTLRVGRNCVENAFRVPPMRDDETISMVATASASGFFKDLKKSHPDRVTLDESAQTFEAIAFMEEWDEDPEVHDTSPPDGLDPDEIDWESLDYE